MNDFKQGMGFHTMWGLSPSFDLLLYQTTVAATDTATSVAGTVAAKQEEINILLVHPGDARHVVHTLGRHGCRCRRQQQQQQQHVNIFILESEIEILARHILQMKIFLDDYIPIRHRASLYLELYNGLISERGYDYVNQAGKDLGEFVYGDDVIGNGNGGDDDELSRLRHLVDLSWLKQKERDALYHVFQNEWCGSGIVSGSGVSSVNTGGSLSDTGGNGRSKLHHDKLQEVNVELLRDYRLRGYYGDRYDCRHNLSEYDYYTRVKQTAGIIHVDQWRKWRMTGIAYEFGSNNVMYDKQNRTMMTSINKSGIINQNVKGYWLDIINGPYISHGVEIDDDDLTAVLDATHDNTTKNIYARGLLEVLNQGTGAEQYRHHTVEVSMFNLMDYMWGFETGTKYIMTKEHDIFSGLDTSSCHSNGRAMATTTTAKAQLASQNNQEQHRKESCNDCHDEAHVNTKENMKRMTPISVTKSQRKLGLHGITIIPLLGDLDNVLSKKKKYQGRFDYVFLSQRVAHWLGSDKFKSILRLHCIIPDDNNNNNNNNNNQFNVEEYMECREANFGNYYNKYYIGPVCSSSGKSIHLKVFTDASCTTLAPSGTYEKYNYNYALPYSKSSIVDSGCISCKQEDNNQQQQQNNNNNQNGYYYEQPRVNEMCQQLYEGSAKCETNLKYKSSEYRDTGSCMYINKIIPSLEKVYRKSGGGGGGATFMAVFFFMTTLGSAGTAYYFHTKVERSSVDLSSQNGDAAFA